MIITPSSRNTGRDIVYGPVNEFLAALEVEGRGTMLPASVEK